MFCLLGINERRLTEFSSGAPLKNARNISLLVTSARVVLDKLGFNAQIMQWGQFISHEFTQLSESEGLLVVFSLYRHKKYVVNYRYDYICRIYIY